MLGEVLVVESAAPFSNGTQQACFAVSGKYLGFC